MDSIRSAEIAAEQVHIDAIYRELDRTREQARYRLRRAASDPIAGTPGSMGEREAMVSGYVRRLTELNAVDERLCFGRLDLVSSDTRYIGRIGLSDAEQNPLLMDWRADAAAAFYQATARNPMGVVRRRNISTDARVVTNLDDDVLMIDELSSEQLATVTGSDSLLTALDSARTGRMRDIVATIQAEQDEIIRTDARGILVVEGGPGTGKSVVALHRVAYLLYAHRDRIARSGALIVGPNRMFVDYIDHVLPALGETGVVLRSLDDFVAGYQATAIDDAPAANVKGSLVMADVLANAVRLYQRVPARAETLDIDGQPLRIDPSLISAAILRAQQTRQPHNEARSTYAKDALRRIARLWARRLNMEPDEETLASLIADLRERPEIRRIVNFAWLPRTPSQLLNRLFSDPEFLASAAPMLSSSEREILLRPSDSPWTRSDVPLLDEACELIGEATTSSTGNRTDSNRELSAARAALADAGAAAGMITAEQYAARFAIEGDVVPLAERAQADRSWVYGHVVVDEAQELTPMQWRMIMRRSPTKSMTIVGDPAQASSPAAVGNWTTALDPYVQQRWKLRSLTVNYRTPQQIMDVAGAFHAAAGLPGNVPTAVRTGSWPVQLVRTSAIAEAVESAIAQFASDFADGTLAVICDPTQLAAVLARQQGFAQTYSAKVQRSVAVLSPSEVKGLEYDSVVIVEPSQWPAVRRDGDLYVALTRATQQLTIIHNEELPAALATAVNETMQNRSKAPAERA